MWWYPVESMAKQQMEGAVSRFLHKKYVHLFLIAVACLLGLLIMLYPVISNLLYDTRQDGVIQAYEAEIDASEDASVLQALVSARRYNRQLASGVKPLHDPFLSPEAEDADERLRSLMDVTGTGVIATLDIPVLSLSLPVYCGTDNETLEHGIGVLEISSLPVGGESTHSVLCGHSGLSTAKLFSDLELMKAGDCFSLRVLGEVLTYQVDQITTVLPEDFSQLEIEPGKDFCTLLTCTPFGVNTHRLLVRGTRIPTPERPISVSTEETPLQSVWVREYIKSVFLGLVVVLCCVVVSLLIHSARRGKR